MIDNKLDTSYIYELTLKLAKEPRFSGSKGEERARRIIIEELSSFGYKAFTESFEIEVFNIKRAYLEVTNPNHKEIECSGVGFSGSTGPEGVEGELIYVENSDRLLIPTRKGWIGLASSRPDRDSWAFLAKYASGLVITENSPYRELSHIDIPVEWYRSYGNLPAVYIRFDDAYQLLKAKSVKLILDQEFYKALSYNIIAEAPGKKYPDEIILVTAHYDSVYDVPGAIDNAGGTAFVIALAKALKSFCPKRTIRFILFSGEELGLRGSRAYVERHEEELEKIKLVVNLDVHGGGIGTNSAVVTGPKSLVNYVEALAKRNGLNMKITEDIMSSDGTSFARENIPVVNFYRGSGAGHDIHTVRDNLRYVHPLAYKTLGPIVLSFLLEIADAEILPFPREIPENLKKKVDEYFEKRLGFSKKS